MTEVKQPSSSAPLLGGAEKEAMGDVALDIVHMIRDGIDEIRTIFLAKTTSNNAAKQSDLDFSLYSELTKTGYCHRVQTLLQGTRIRNLVCLDSKENVDSTQDDGHRLVMEILLPLLQSLAYCYRSLDEAHSTGPEEDSTVPTSKLRVPIHQSSETGKLSLANGAPSTRQSPDPPVAMLSLKNYTDIAVWLELIVCFSVLPHLEPNVRHLSLDSRWQHHISKFIRGRIPTIHSLRYGAEHVSKPCHSAITQLQCAVIAILDLTLLDRFRPMLFPRHVTDVYAAVFQCEALQRLADVEETRLQLTDHSDMIDSPDSCVVSVYARIARQLLLAHSADEGAASGEDMSPVDNVIKVRSFQELLGVPNSPKWLRLRISALMQEMSVVDLPSVIHVFVHSAMNSSLSASSNTATATAASARLAHALLLPPRSLRNGKLQCRCSEQYFGQLTWQLVRVLDRIISTGTRAESTRINVSEYDAISIQSIWAIVDGLPPSLLVPILVQPGKERDHIVRRVVSNGSFPGRISVPCFIRRLQVLVDFIPSHISHRKLYNFLFTPIRTTDLEVTSPEQNAGNYRSVFETGTLPMTVLAMIFRVASVPSVLHYPIKEAARNIARDIVEILAASPTEGSTDSGPAAVPIPPKTVSGSLAAALLLAVSPVRDETCAPPYKMLELPICGNGNAADDRFCEGNKALVWEKEKGLVSEETLTKRLSEDTERRIEWLIKDVFIPLASVPGATATGPARLNSVGPRLISSFFLLCLAVFVDGRAAEQSNSLSCLRNDFVRMASVASLPILCEECSPEHLLFAEEERINVFEIMALVLRCLAQSYCSSALSTARRISTYPLDFSLLQDVTLNFGKGTGPQSSSLGADEDMLVSISSILLSLLVGILELGAEDRPLPDEAELTSLLGNLKTLSGDQQDETAPRLPSEIAEMASHALVLLASRSQRASWSEHTLLSSFANDTNGSFHRRLHQVKLDLSSHEAPLRARGAVRLRYVAEGFRGGLEAEPNFVDALTLAISAVSDSESYVYLAAIQTISVLADAKPMLAFQVLGNLVATSRSIMPDSSELSVSPAERIKLTEALIFSIRKRATVCEHIPFLVDLLVYGYGPTHQDDRRVQFSSRQEIAAKTHEYFLGTAETGFNCDESSSGDCHGEHRLRLSTGGPVFTAEEDDVVRSCRISVLAELVSVSSPRILADSCFALVRTALSALRLDMSRPVRRMGALLARELYSALIREQDEVLDRLEGKLDRSSAIPFALAFIQADEPSLRECVSRVRQGEDRYDLGEEKERCDDPATAARCLEAQNLIAEAKRGGVFDLAAGMVAINAQSQLPLVAAATVARGHEPSLPDLVQLGSTRRITVKERALFHGYKNSQ
jgi:Required for nuclear transport of RNA pol II C-terminus 1